MNDFLQQLRGPGELECRGEFSLDVEQAQRKMSHFQLRQPQDFLYHMAAGLFRLGATRLDIDREAWLLTLSFPPLPLNEGFLENLAGSLFEEQTGQRRLAAAVQHLTALNPLRFDWIGTADNRYDYLTGTGHKWSKVSLRQIQIEGLSHELLDQALQELSQRAAWSRRPLSIGRRSFQHAQGLTRQLGGCPAECEWAPGEKSQLRLIMDELVVDSRPIEAPFAWTGICYGEFRLDASLAQVVEDETLEKILAEVPATFASCVRLGLLKPQSDAVLPLLQLPFPDWLQPLAPKLLELDIFEDQNRRRWSLQQLLEAEQPVYLAEDRKDWQALEAIVLIGQPLAAQNCLRCHLGERLQKADQLLLRQLQRLQHQRLWRQQAVLPLALPPGHWLFQQEFNHGSSRWIVGVPDDWSKQGAGLTLWVEGRKLAASRLILQEFACEIVCEIDPEQVNDLWTGLDSRAWNELEPLWNESIRRVMHGFADGRESRADIRPHLLQHLAGCLQPEDSYFCDTLLFEDWHGRLYSLKQLLSPDNAPHLGLVSPSFQPQDFPQDLIPEGIYLRDSGPERSILQKLQVPLLLLDRVLEDILTARSQVFEGQRLEVLPAFGLATIWFSTDQIALAPVSLDCDFAYEAHLRVDGLQVHTKPSNLALGTERFQAVDDECAQAALKQIEERVLPSILLQFQQNPEEEWLDWLRQATLRDLLPEPLLEVACWPRYPEGHLSLRKLCEAPQIHWSSGQAAPQAAAQLQGSVLLTGLAHQAQAYLQTKASSAEWICLDEAFARENQQSEFLRRPLWPARFLEAIDQKGQLWVMPSGGGRVYWLHQGRLIEETASGVPFGIRLAIDCPGLDPADRRQDPAALSWEALREWLAAPRPPLLAHWQQWLEQAMPESILRLLQKQPWFLTNQGARSWQQIMDQPEVWLFAGSPRPEEKSLFLVFESERLLSNHPNLHPGLETVERLAALRALQVQKHQAQQKSLNLRGLRYRIETDYGELALSGDSSKNVWLLDGTSQTLVENLPVGVAGFVHCEARIRVLRSEQPVAEISPNTRAQLIENLAELIQQRVAAGPLRRDELDLVAEVCQTSQSLDSLRWIECADGSYTSLQQLRQESSERGKLLYWSRNYVLRSGGAALLPILSSPLMLEAVTRACSHAPELAPPPLLYREVGVHSFRSALGALARVMQRGKLPVLEGIREVAAAPAVDPRAGQVLLEALRRRASQLLSGTARRECLQYLEGAQLRAGLSRLWEFQEHLLLCADHPLLRNWLGAQEPPLAVQTSLLLSLVCAINALSEPFTDEMELEFLEQLGQDILESLPQ